MMLFIDEGAKAEFAKAEILLQVACSFLEFEAAKYGSQIEFIDFENEFAIIQADSLTTFEMVAAAMAVNKMFKRRDGKDTCLVFDLKLKFFKCRQTKLTELTELM